MRCAECGKFIAAAMQIDNPKRRQDKGKLVCGACHARLNRAKTGIAPVLKKILDDKVIMSKGYLELFARAVFNTGHHDLSHSMLTMLSESWTLAELTISLELDADAIVGFFER